MAWTTPGTAVAGDVLTATRWNTDVRDNTNNLDARVKTGIESYTTTDRNALTGVATGTMIYNSTEKQVQVYNGSSWIETNDLDNTNGVPSGLNPFFAGYTSYTPTLTQLGAVPKTSTSKYLKVGRFVHVQFHVNITGAGGTAGNVIAIGLPVTIASGYDAFDIIGMCTLYDASTFAVYPGFVTALGHLSVTSNGRTNGTQYLGINDFGAALATSDQIGGSFMYEAAS